MTLSRDVLRALLAGCDSVDLVAEYTGLPRRVALYWLNRLIDAGEVQQADRDWGTQYLLAPDLVTCRLCGVELNEPQDGYLCPTCREVFARLTHFGPPAN